MSKNLIISILLIIIVVSGGAYLVSQREATPVNQVPDEMPADNNDNIPIAPVSTNKEFGKNITLNLNQKVTFTDGLTVALTAVDDSRCPKDVQCIWAGELGVTLEVSKGSISNPGEVRLGTVTKETATVENYVFTLKDASTKNVPNVTILVQNKKAVAAGGCFVGGCSSEVCSDQKDVASNCIYKEEFACYKTAKCERQAGGQCGWTNNNALLECLAPYYPGE